VVTAASPANGPATGGTVVTISGSNLTGATQVLFGDVAGTAVTVVSATELKATAPAHARGVAGIWVTTPAGASGAATTFSFLDVVGLNPVRALSNLNVAPGAVQCVLIAGSFEQDVKVLRRLRVRPPVIGAVAGGIGAFANELGRRAEGVLAPSQWEEGVHFAVGVGPRSIDVVRALRARVLPTLSAGTGTGHVEYPCAQAYATVLVALRCVQETGSLDDKALLDAARRLRCTTFFGRFGLGDDGRQSDHDLLVVQWRAGMKRIVWPPDRAETELDPSSV